MGFYYIFSLSNKTEMLGIGNEEKLLEGNRSININRKTMPYPYGTFFFKLFELLAPMIEDTSPCQSDENGERHEDRHSVYLMDCFEKFTGFDTFSSGEVFAEIISDLFSNEMDEFFSSKPWLADKQNVFKKYLQFKNKLIEKGKLESADINSLREEFFSDCEPLSKSLILSDNAEGDSRLLERLKKECGYLLSNRLSFQDNRGARVLVEIPLNSENRTISEKHCEAPYLVFKIETISGLLLALFESIPDSRCGRIQTCEVCGSHFFTGRAEAKYCYWRCPVNPPKSRASCDKQVRDNRKQVDRKTSKLGKKIHSNYVSFDNKYSIVPEKRGRPEAERKKMKNEAWTAMSNYLRELEEWKKGFILCKVTKDQFYDWLCSKVPTKDKNHVLEDPNDS